MPEERDPRIHVRVSPDEHATLEAMSKAVNVTLSGFLRECALRYGAAALNDLQAGNIKARRRDPTRPQAIPKKVAGLRRASELLEPESYDAMMLARQQRLNRGIERSRGKPS